MLPNGLNPLPMISIPQSSQNSMSALQSYSKIANEVKLQKSFAERMSTNINLKCDIHQDKLSRNCRQCKKIKEASQQDEDQQNLDKDFSLNEYYYSIGDRGDNIFPINGDSSIQNINSLLRENILNCTYFRELYLLRTYHEVIAEIEKTVTHAEPWAVGGSGVPSSLFCCLYKFMTMNLTVNQVKGLTEYRANSYVRACGYLYIRYVCDPNFLWAWMKRYILDDEEINPSIDHSKVITIGEYVENLLIDHNYYNTRLPRIPMQIDHKIQTKIQLTREKRKKKLINQKLIGLFVRGAKVRAISRQDEEWHMGVVERFEGKLLLIRFTDEINQKSGFKGGSEPVNLGEVELIPQDQEHERRIIQLVEASEGHDEIIGQIEVEAQIPEPQIMKKKSRSRSRSKKKNHKHKHRHRSSSSSSSSNKKKHKHHRHRNEEAQKNNRIYESNKEKQDRIQKEIREKTKESAVASSKADVARIPASYKSSLSGAPQTTIQKQSRSSPSPVKKEKFVQMKVPGKQEIEKKEVPIKAINESTPESLAFSNDLKKRYGDEAGKSRVNLSVQSDRVANDYA